MAHEPPKYAESQLISVFFDFIKSFRIFIIFIGVFLSAVFWPFSTVFKPFCMVFASFFKFPFFASWRHGGAVAPSRRRRGATASVEESVVRHTLPRVLDERSGRGVSVESVCGHAGDGVDCGGET